MSRERLSPADLLLCSGTMQAVPLLDRLEPARKAGFAGITVFAADIEVLLAEGHTLADIRARVADAGLLIGDVEIIGCWLSDQTPPTRMPRWLGELLMRSTPEALLAIATGLGAERVTIGELFGVPFNGDRMAEAFAGICDRAAGEGIGVALEFIPTGGIPDLSSGWEVIRKAGRPNGGLLVDSWHLFRSGSTLAELAGIPGDAIASVQINDAPAAASDDLDREMIRGRMLPGEGELDIAGFLATLDAIGSRAPIGVEVFSETLSALPPDEVARRCAETARGMIAQQKGLTG